MTARTACGACGSAGLDLILDLGTSPLADEFPATPAEALALPRYPLQLLACTSCWLVQLGYVVPDAELWSDRYGFYTGASPSSVAYFAAYADWLAAGGLLPGQGELAVEIASNDGTLLQHLCRAGGQVLGVEPAKGPAEAARAQGLEVTGQMFGLAVAEQIRSVCGPAQLVVANNVLAHVADLTDFLAGVRHLLAPGGAFVVEVQYLPDLLLGNQFDHVYHEHRSFFSVSSLAYALADAVFIGSVTRTPAQGGSVRIVGRRSAASADQADYQLRESAWLGPKSLTGLQGRADALRDRLVEVLTGESAKARRVLGVGASAKSATLLNWCGLGPDVVAQVHDLTPSKAGRFTPGTGIPITTDPLPPGKDVSALVLTHNYLPGILRREAGFLAEGGRFVVPIPQPVVI